jgi:hypothetical protein
MMYIGFTDQTANWRVRTKEAVFRMQAKVHKRKYHMLYFPSFKKCEVWQAVCDTVSHLSSVSIHRWGGFLVFAK